MNHSDNNSPTNPSSREVEEAPDRVWIWTGEPYQWHETKTDESDVEYIRADLVAPASTAPVVDRQVVGKALLDAVDTFCGQFETLGERFKKQLRNAVRAAIRSVPVAAATAAPVEQSDEKRLKPPPYKPWCKEHHQAPPCTVCDWEVVPTATPSPSSTSVRAILSLDDTGNGWYHVVREDKIVDDCREVIYSSADRAFCQLLVNAVNCFSAAEKP